MRSKSVHIHWRFLLERLPVKDSHQDIARKMLITIQENKQLNQSGKQRRFGTTASTLSESFVLKTLESSDSFQESLLSSKSPEEAQKFLDAAAASNLRQLALREIRSQTGDAEMEDKSVHPTDQSTESSKVHDIWSQSGKSSRGERGTTSANKKNPSTPLSSLETTTKEKLSPRSEKSSEMLLSDYSFPSVKSPHNASSKETPSVITARTATTAKSLGTAKSTRSAARSRQSASTPLWINAEQAVPHFDAFSEHSLTQGVQRGLIDAEGHLRLRKVDKDSERKEIFSRSVPQVMLRNTAMSAHVKMPSLTEARTSEVLFGVQKVLL
jgi:hypothetical protein